MFCSCKFNEKCDIAKTSQGLAVDLNRAIETGIVSDTGTEVDYSHVEECSEVGSRVSDVFEGIDRMRAYRKSFERASNRSEGEGKKLSIVNP